MALGRDDSDEHPAYTQSIGVYMAHLPLGLVNTEEDDLIELTSRGIDGNIVVGHLRANHRVSGCTGRISEISVT